MPIIRQTKGTRFVPRPQCIRRVSTDLNVTYFKPRGIPLSRLQEIVLTLDELEAMRLVDFDGLYQEAAADRMGISRQTLGRILESARHSVTEALIRGKALRIEGGEVIMSEMRKFSCSDCGNNWELPYGGGRQSGCPKCGSANLHRTDRGCSLGGSRGQGRQRGNRHGARA